jgi:alkylated DNA nucleotide flippase Atl1
MSIVQDKYRKTTTYFHVLAELVRAAQYRGLTTYQDIAVIMGITVTGNHMAKQTGKILGEISEDEVRAGRPMLSAVAVSVQGYPSKGFYVLARELGLLKSGQDERKFWEQQREAVYAAWKRPLPIKAAGSA